MRLHASWLTDAELAALASASMDTTPVPAAVFDCKVARHGNMIVGKTGAGKSEAWKCLTRAMARLKEIEPENENYQRVHVHPINPLALSNDEM